MGLECLRAHAMGTRVGEQQRAQVEETAAPHIQIGYEIGHRDGFYRSLRDGGRKKTLWNIRGRINAVFFAESIQSQFGQNCPENTTRGRPFTAFPRSNRAPCSRPIGENGGLLRFVTGVVSQ